MNNKLPYQIRPFGRHAIIIKWDPKIDKNTISVIASSEEAIDNLKIEGVIELVPTYNELTVYFEPAIIDMSSVTELCQMAIQNRSKHSNRMSKIWEIDVCYDEEYGIDLQRVSDVTGLSIEEIIDAHSSHCYDVHFFGFLPGFMYLGGLDSKLTISRLDNPRKFVQRGSVAIANGQTGIYPVNSPGGWNIIGKSNFKVFDHKCDPPSKIKVGDQIKFAPIDKDSFKKMVRDD